jgi:hypothetical protein
MDLCSLFFLVFKDAPRGYVLFELSAYRKVFKARSCTDIMKDFMPSMWNIMLADEEHPWDDLKGHPWDD